MEVCNKNENLERNVELIRFRSIFYSQKYNLMVCAAPKVGSSTWITFMLLMRGMEGNRTKNVHTSKMLALVRAQNVLGKEATRHVQSTTTLMSVRHPLERLNSAFRSKFANGGPLHKHLSPSFYSMFWKPALKMLNKNPDVEQYITFAEFLQYAVYRGDAHWLPMHTMCSPCAMHYEYFVRLETFSEDMQYLSHALSNPILDLQVHMNEKRKTTKGPQHGMQQTDHTQLSNSTLLIYRQVPSELLAKVLQIYRPDLDLFGYQVPEELTRRAGLLHGSHE